MKMWCHAAIMAPNAPVIHYGTFFIYRDKLMFGNLLLIIYLFLIHDYHAYKSTYKVLLMYLSVIALTDKNFFNSVLLYIVYRCSCFFTRLGVQALSTTIGNCFQSNAKTRLCFTKVYFHFGPFSIFHFHFE